MAHTINVERSKEEIIRDILTDFFKEEERNVFVNRFAESLQNDFKQVLDDFAKFIERRYDILRKPPEFKILEALPGFLNGLYGYKESYLKQHYNMLINLPTGEQ